ncbi:nucleotidyltransferase domain-containing protein [Aquimarina sp. ERC-38]|uniref:nucleotidyltransferase family protein n=1 Tax=Aquimarina sp. ERC-38 TaxID=2949996 RepID=UPI0022455FA6|nr:nucleotidyltransferase domain-containing protein [Aquimarina sp. ERC-38]UZO81299.1 nucleotidyltransferase domain-containing protein [Aquimarina sp. ERC-38]
MLSKQEVISKILDHKEQIKAFGISELGLFGSYVREQQTKESDIDLLIDFESMGSKSFRSFMDFCYFVEDLFTTSKADIVTKNGLSKYIGPQILKEVEYVEIC